MSKYGQLRSWEGMARGIRLKARGIRPRWRLEAQGIKERLKIAHAKRTNKETSVFIGYFGNLAAWDAKNVVLQLFATQEHLQIRDRLGDILKIACKSSASRVCKACESPRLSLKSLYKHPSSPSLGVHA